MNKRLKKITNFLIEFDKEFTLKKWDNLEGTDIYIEEIIISIPDDFESVIHFKFNDEIKSIGEKE